MRRRSPLKLLFAVYFVAVLAGLCEVYSGPRIQMLNLEIYGSPGHNFPEMMWRMYPDRPDSEYMLGMEFDAGATRQMMIHGPQFQPQSTDEVTEGFREAAKHYERAIHMGMKSEERLYYNYVLALIRIRADSDRIDRAIADWRQHFPNSTRPDLAQTRQAMERQR